MVTAEFSVVGESKKRKRQEELVKLALEPVQRRGLRYEVEPLGTTISGEIEDKLEGFRHPALETHEALETGS
jgi:uncharacterized protein YqgV (UPF0045/DUF77 family)